MPYARVLLISALLANAVAVTGATAQSLCNPCVDPPVREPPAPFQPRRAPIEPDTSVHSRERCGIAISRTYGGGEWLVSDCIDGVVVVAPPTGRIATGSYFMFSRPNGGAYELDEQRTSPGTGAHAAYLELRGLSPLEVAALIAAVKVNACRNGQVRSCNPPFR
jgi:hypothetical protein